MSKLEILLWALAIVITSIVTLIISKKYRNRIKLTYLEEDCLELFKSIVKNMEGLEIYYEKRPINPSLIMLKASIINSGTNDVENSIVHKPLSVKLPKGYKWIKVKITDKSPGIEIKHNMLSKSELEFKWDLIKKNEYFRFESLIEAPLEETKENKIDAKTISKNIFFSHRITNLEGVERFEKEKYLKIGLPERIMFNFIMAIMFGFFILAVFLKPAFLETKGPFDIFMEKLSPYLLLSIGIITTIFYIRIEIKLKKRKKLFRLVHIIK